MKKERKIQNPILFSSRTGFLLWVCGHLYNKEMRRYLPRALTRKNYLRSRKREMLSALLCSLSLSVLFEKMEKESFPALSCLHASTIHHSILIFSFDISSLVLPLLIDGWWQKIFNQYAKSSQKQGRKAEASKERSIGGEKESLVLQFLLLASKQTMLWFHHSNMVFKFW